MRNDDARAPRKLVLAASTGGHLVELFRLLPTLDASDDSLWITFRTAQSEALLAGRRVLYVPYIKPRDLLGTARAMVTIRAALRKEGFDGAVSTGAAIALAALPVAGRLGIPTTYIESLSRVHRPSMTGKLLSLYGRTEMRTQVGEWTSGSWTRHESVLGNYTVLDIERETPSPRLFVTLGTIKGYRFDSLVDAVLASGLADENTVWQTGHTLRAGLPGRVHTHMSQPQFDDAVAKSDVVIAHSGVGTLLDLLDAGKFPLMATRRASRGEHVDDHQVELQKVVNDSGVGISVDGPDVTAQLILECARRQVVAGGQTSASHVA